jgi:hypothetical protein
MYVSDVHGRFLEGHSEYIVIVMVLNQGKKSSWSVTQNDASVYVLSTFCMC